MDCRLKLDLEIPEGISKKIVESIKPDADTGFERRVVSRMNINKNVLSLEISARDPTALRAAFNSYMKLIGLCNQLSKDV